MYQYEHTNLSLSVNVIPEEEKKIYNLTTALLLHAISTLNNTVRVCAVIFYGHLVRLRIESMSMPKKNCVPFTTTHAYTTLASVLLGYGWCDALWTLENKNGWQNFFRAFRAIVCVRREGGGKTHRTTTITNYRIHNSSDERRWLANLHSSLGRIIFFFCLSMNKQIKN